MNAMSLDGLAPVLNHLWQSTVFAAGASVLALALRKYRPHVRFWIWLAASLKFLLPLALLVDLGGWLHGLGAPASAAGMSAAGWRAVQDFGQTLIAPATAVAPAMAGAANVVAARAINVWVLILCGVWSCGFAVVLFGWVREWWGVRAMVRNAAPLDLGLPIRAVVAPARLELGVFGLWRPVLFVPASMLECLAPEQFKAVVAHELWHVRRRDNLWAALHVLVQAIFWFHPLVWWLGARMVWDRELACDEGALRQGAGPKEYALGILRVCELYAKAPACVAGISGSELKARVLTIANGAFGKALGMRMKWLLAALGAASLALPLAAGMALAPRTPQQGAAPPHFDVISIKPIPHPRILHPYAAAKAVYPGGRYFNPYAFLYDLFAFAYPEYTADKALTGFPVWGLASGDYYAVEAKAAPNTSPSLAQMRLMMQSLLASRFGFKFHIDHRVMPVFFLEVAKGGTRNIKPSAPDEQYEYPATLLAIEFYGATARAVTMRDVASRLSAALDRPVLDRTDMTGRYDFDVPREPNNNLPGTPQESFFTALRGKLGLELVAGNATAPVMVIDHVHRPTPN